ncbi:hypothetical protein [Aeromicrobium terrae]|uniref:DUF2238 domain-containing protein n=1 Tax=Aeromicrobium terrae TaxID=2498846 RepID=A0A5C8NFB8_9ACTN|nr:hypothetical protein [Aeromicrobium terrae]TXL57489.1 hypothetical protein FHP06_14035 [Aeromicrobium terrae]
MSVARAERAPERVTPSSDLQVVAAIDLLAKLILVLFLVRVSVDRAWGHMEGKAPLTRAIVYPCLGAVVPLLHLVRNRAEPYPWAADLLVTLAGFSDILGNRLDLYDRIRWFDDWMHVMNTGFVAAAVLLLTTTSATLGRLLERSVAVGMTTSLVWEVWEYFAFVTRSPEHPDAYADTVGDLALGWIGALTAAIVVAEIRRRHAGARE